MVVAKIDPIGEELLTPHTRPIVVVVRLPSTLSFLVVLYVTIDHQHYSCMSATLATNHVH